jgi:hypothetical protein
MGAAYHAPLQADVRLGSREGGEPCCWSLVLAFIVKFLLFLRGGSVPPMIVFAVLSVPWIIERIYAIL